MLELTQEQIRKNNALLDLVKADQGLKNDADLARFLEMSPSTLSKIRHGTAVIGISVLARMHEDHGYPFAVLRKYVPARVGASKEENA